MLTTVPMICYLVAFGLIYIAIVHRVRHLPAKTKKDTGNELLNAFMWFVGAFFYPFAYSPSIDLVVRDSFNIFTDVAMVGIFLVIFVILARQKVLVSKQPTLIVQRSYDTFSASFTREYTLKMDIARKAFHAFIPAFVIAAYVLGNVLVSVAGISFVSGHDLGIFFIINCGFGGLFLFGAADIVRLSWYFKERGLSIFHLLPTSVLNILTKRMHFKELSTFIPTGLILLSFIPFLPAPFAVFSSVALIASISDAFASITGKAFHARCPDRLMFPKKSYFCYKEKNCAGYIAGFISTFLIVLAMLACFPIPALLFQTTAIISLVVAIVFVLIDILSLPVNDNLLNPVACGVVMLVLLAVA